jgi:hypothetical protein
MKQSGSEKSKVRFRMLRYSRYGSSEAGRAVVMVVTGSSGGIDRAVSDGMGTGEGDGVTVAVTVTGLSVSPDRVDSGVVQPAANRITDNKKTRGIRLFFIFIRYSAGSDKISGTV